MHQHVNKLHQPSWHCPHNMQSRLYEIIQCPSVCPSICLSHSPAAAACGGFAAVGLAGRRNRLTAAEAACGSGQCDAVSIRTVAKHRLVYTLLSSLAAGAGFKFTGRAAELTCLPASTIISITDWRRPGFRPATACFCCVQQTQTLYSTAVHISDVKKTTRFKTKTKTTSVKTQDQDQDHRNNNNVLAPDSQRNYFLQHNIL